MEPIDYEAEYEEIKRVLKEHGGKLDYRTLNEILADKFEGIRLRLKTMKEKGLVECLNPKDRNFRFYELTNMGKQILSAVNKILDEIKED